MVLLYRESGLFFVTARQDSCLPLYNDDEKSKQVEQKTGYIVCSNKKRNLNMNNRCEKLSLMEADGIETVERNVKTL